MLFNCFIDHAISGVYALVFCVKYMQVIMTQYKSEVWRAKKGYHCVCFQYTRFAYNLANYLYNI